MACQHDVRGGYGHIDADSKTAPGGAVGPDRSGVVQDNPTPRHALGPTTRTLVLVDGFNLYFGLKAMSRRKHLWLDLLRLAEAIRPNDDIVEVRYFTAMIKNDPAGRSRQEQYHAALAAHCGSRLSTVLGRFQEKPVRCRDCGSTWSTYEEKETDVSMAVALVSAAATSGVDLIVVVSADSDLCPAIREVRSIAPHVGLIAAFPPRRSSLEMKSLVPGNFIVGRDKIRRSQLPDVVVDDSGREFRRPVNWH